MKTVVLTGVRRMELVDAAKPKIKNDTDVLLKIETVGVCGSDVHYYETGKIGSQIVEYPFIVGHECAATVEAVGQKCRFGPSESQGCTRCGSGGASNRPGNQGSHESRRGRGCLSAAQHALKECPEIGHEGTVGGQDNREAV